MQFNLSRFLSLINRDFILHKKGLIVSVSALCLLLLLVVVFGHQFKSPDQFTASIQMMVMAFVVVLVIGGGLLTASNLGDLKTAVRRADYLSIPASNFEKVLSKWLYSLPLFLIVVSFIFLFYESVYIGIYGDSFTEEGLQIATRMKYLVLHFVSLYVVGHSVAFFFSFLFNSFAAIKGGLISLFILFITGILLAFLNIQGVQEHFEYGDGSISEVFSLSYWNLMIYIDGNATWLMLCAPLFWVFAYLVFKRKTV